jgi:hypothetical protein
MWQYKDLESRKQTREKAWQVDTWSQTVSRVRCFSCFSLYALLIAFNRVQTVKLCTEMHSNILEPLPFSPLR